MKVLVGDIGGTNARFRLLEGEAHQWCLRHQSTWSSADYDSLEALLETLMTNFSRLEQATIDEVWLAVAGPVRAGRVAFTNLPWKADSDALAARFGWNRVALVNDLEALGHALPGIVDNELMQLQQGRAADGNRLIVAVGTGLGVAMLKPDTEGIEVFASEGGHTDFAPVEPTDFELRAFLQARYGHVSQERVLSGQGVADLYRFVCEQQGQVPEPGLLEAPDPAAAINQRAESAQAPVALASIRLFARLLGRFVGNAALFSAAMGGVYLCGGVATRLHPYLCSGEFLAAFRDHGRMAPLMDQIPVWTIGSTEVGLNGITALGTRYGVTGMPIDRCPVDQDSQPVSPSA